MAAYSVYYPTGCDAQIGNHTCNTCDTTEHGRVRSIAFIKNSFTFIDPTSPVEWTNGILSKQIIVIPEVNGTFDGGSEVEAPGYGNQVTKLTGYNFTLTFKDPNYAQNAAFYNAIKRSRGYYAAYRTESLVHIITPTVQVIPKNPVTDSTTDEVTWQVTIKWSGADLPQPYNDPDLLSVCFDYTT